MSEREGREYRVRWRREGLQGASAIYQTEAGARAKAHRLMAVDRVKAGSWLSETPDLAESPKIQVREVGPWQDSADQPCEPPDDVVASMEEWAVPSASHGEVF